MNITESHNIQKRQANQAVGLFAHPRVGRSDPDLEWDNSMMPANGIDDYDGIFLNVAFTQVNYVTIKNYTQIYHVTR